MKPANILTILGARPQFIKASMVSRALAHLGEGRTPPPLHEDILHTGQHFDPNMSAVFFDEMHIPAPVANLAIAGGTHGSMTARMLAAIEGELLIRKPDCVLVYGDTNSTLAGALAASKLHIPVAHVEAGLRSFNRAMPEEINRVVTDHISTLLFCPSEASAEQLSKEGITENVHVVGDVMYDATLHFRDKSHPPLIEPPFALATIHRAGNTDSPTRLRAVFQALEACPVPVLLPLHPRTRNALAHLGMQPSGAIKMVEPLSYLDMLGCLDACSFVLTDSGGLQKEAFFLGKRCLTLRPETEWTELLDAGWNRLVEPEDLGGTWVWAMALAQADAPRPGLYGDGHAAGRIADILASHFSNGRG